MEVNIKYKEIDKKAEVLECLINRTETIRGMDFKNTVDFIDAIYKEDSKQISRAEIRIGDFITNTISTSTKEKSDVVFGIEYKCGKTCDYFDTVINKEELTQYIDILTTIKNQMEG